MEKFCGWVLQCKIEENKFLQIYLNIMEKKIEMKKIIFYGFTSCKIEEN